MSETNSIAGQVLRDMFSTATSWLEKSSADIDALNVFPVPDGDTGTNMMLTMRSTMEEAYRAPDNSASAIAHAMAKGALMGARGNSGVILSQIWRGMAQGLDGKESFNAAEMAEALLKSADIAYKGVSNPVEGTMLTVMKDAAKEAKAQVDRGEEDVIGLLEAVVNAAGDSVARTPRLLKVLKDAGVVDAGGQGLYTILEGALRFLKGELELMRLRKPQIIVSDLPSTVPLPQATGVDEVPFGYCTEFLLKGEKLEPESISKRLEKKGESLIVVGDESAVRIHIHTLEPGSIVQFATKLGTLHQVSIRNMDEQHQDFLEMQKERMPTTDTAVIAVASGDGLKDVFGSLGAAAVIPGGQTMNPSTKDILQAVQSVPSENVIILPNNKNIILTAGQVESLTEKKIKVVPTRTIPQGVVALLAFDYEADFKTNAEIMEKALSSVKTIEVTKSVRATRINGLHIKRKQPIGLLDDELIAAGDTDLDVINKILDKLDMKEAEVVTIYYGEDVQAEEAEKISASITEQYTNLQVELIKGNQPHYSYILSIE
ncbi:MAG: dihydroxyacetone kinase [Chloroflexi bacterium RBG_13_51_52]|nr:MAG: dihydroxyacetone kinase [Chloroflexi bacterium RBG_13_51_52]